MHEMKQLQIKGLDMEVTDAIREYVEQRVLSLGKIINFNDPLVRISVELGRSANHHKQDEQAYRTEIHLTIPGHTLFAQSFAPDLYASIDEVRDDIMRQVRDTKGRSKSLFRRGGAALKKLLRLE